MGTRLRRLRLAARKALRKVVYSKGSPSSIAGGAALGIFIGLTPTMGFQMIPAAFLAALFRVSVVAAVVAVWITNPLTAAPIYYFEYFVGRLILPFEPGSGAVEGIKRLAEKISEISVSDLWRTTVAAVAAFAGLGRDVIIRFLIGSFTCASVGAVLAYPATYFSVRYVRRRRDSRALRRADVRLERLDAAGLVQASQTEPPRGSTFGGHQADRESAGERAAPGATAESLAGSSRPPKVVPFPLEAGRAPGSGDEPSRRGGTAPGGPGATGSGGD